MEFTTPQTEEELINTLNEIYKFYRLKKQSYEKPTLPTIDLEEISYQKMTDEEIELYAKELLKGEHDKEILARVESLKKDIAEKKSQKIQADSDMKEKEKEIIALYKEKIKCLEEDGERNGLIKGSVIYVKKQELFCEQEEKIKQLKVQTEERIKELQGEIDAQSECLQKVDEYYAKTHKSAIDSKIAELRQKQFEFMVEVLKYNNSVQEKNVKYANYIENIKANLELKYIEIRSNPFSKEELIQLGYYPDVIRCVSEYFKRFDKSVVYDEFSGCTQLMLYLEDFYDTVHTYYKKLAQ